MPKLLTSKINSFEIRASKNNENIISSKIKTNQA